MKFTINTAIILYKIIRGEVTSIMLKYGKHLKMLNCNVVYFRIALMTLVMKLLKFRGISLIGA